MEPKVERLKAEKQIAKAICLAQSASDAGKGIFRLHIEGDTEAKYLGYSTKDYWILRAIKIIEHSPRGNFSYFVKEAPDQNGYDSFIIYFNWKVGEKAYQASFHTPFNRADDKIVARADKGVKTHWVGKGKPRNSFIDSYKAVKSLIKTFNL